MNEEIKAKTTEEEKRRALKAKEILDNPIFTETVESIKDLAWRSFLSSKPEAKDLRENIYQELKMLNVIISRIKQISDTGELYGKKNKKR